MNHSKLPICMKLAGLTWIYLVGKHTGILELVSLKSLNSEISIARWKMLQLS